MNTTNKVFLVLTLLWGWVPLAAQTPVRTEIPMEINLGFGPAFHYLPAELVGSTTLVGGLSVELYAVIRPEVLQEHKDRIPRQYRKYISLNQEMFLRPWWLGVIPQRLVIHPTADLKVYGANWNFFTWAWNQQLLEPLQLQVALQLPSITYLRVASPTLAKDAVNLWAVGATPAVRLNWRPWNRWHFAAGWEHSFYLPLGINKYKPAEANSRALTQHGIASVIVHWRIPSSAKI